MDYFQNTVAEWLGSDSRTLLVQEYYLRLSNHEVLSSSNQEYRWPDIVAVRMADEQVFLCEVTWSGNFSELARRVTAYFERLEAVRTSLRYWLGIPEGWQIAVWMFVPRGHVPKLASKARPDWRVRFTALEDIRPWEYVHGCRPADDKLETELP